MIVVILEETHISPHAWTFDDNRKDQAIAFAKWLLDQYEKDHHTRETGRAKGDLLYCAWLEDDGASVAVHDCPHNAPKPWDDHVELPNYR